MVFEHRVAFVKAPIPTHRVLQSHPPATTTVACAEWNCKLICMLIFCRFVATRFLIFLLNGNQIDRIRMSFSLLAAKLTEYSAHPLLYGECRWIYILTGDRLTLGKDVVVDVNSLLMAG